VGTTGGGVDGSRPHAAHRLDYASAPLRPRPGAASGEVPVSRLRAGGAHGGLSVMGRARWASRTKRPGRHASPGSRWVSPRLPVLPGP